MLMATIGILMLIGIVKKNAIMIIDFALDAQPANFDVQQRSLRADELRRADEVFLSSTCGGVIAVAQLDSRDIGCRAPSTFGPVTQTPQPAY